jgi:hypothetical protein
MKKGGGPKKKSSSSKPKTIDRVSASPTLSEVPCPELVRQQFPDKGEQRYTYFIDETYGIEGIGDGCIITPIRTSQDDLVFEINIETHITNDFRDYLATYVTLCADQGKMDQISLDFEVSQEVMIGTKRKVKTYSLKNLIKQHPQYKYYVINTGNNTRIESEDKIQLNKKITITMSFIMNFLSDRLFKVFVDDGLSLEQSEILIDAVNNLQDHVPKDKYIYHICKQLNMNFTLSNPITVWLSRSIFYTANTKYVFISNVLINIFNLMIGTISTKFPYIATICYSITKSIHTYIQHIGLIDPNLRVVVSKKPNQLDIDIKDYDTDISVMDKISERYITPYINILFTAHPDMDIEACLSDKLTLPFNALQTACYYKLRVLTENILDMGANVNVVSVNGYKIIDLVLKQHYTNECIHFVDNKVVVGYEIENSVVVINNRRDKVFQDNLVKILNAILEKLSSEEQYNMLNCPNDYGYTFAHYCALYNYNIVLNDIQKKYPVDRYTPNKHLKYNIIEQYETMGIFEANGDLYPIGIANMLRNAEVKAVLNVIPPFRLATPWEEKHVNELNEKRERDAEKIADALIAEEMAEKSKIAASKQKKQEMANKTNKTKKNKPLPPPPLPTQSLPPPTELLPPPTESLPSPSPEPLPSSPPESLPPPYSMEPISDILEENVKEKEKKKRIRKKKDKPITEINENKENETQHSLSQSPLTLESESSADVDSTQSSSQTPTPTIPDIDNTTILTMFDGQLPSYMDEISGYSYSAFKDEIRSFIDENIHNNPDIDSKIREQIPHYRYDTSTFKIHNKNAQTNYKNKVYALLIVLNALNRHFTENGLCSIVIKGGKAAQFYINNPSRDIDLILTPPMRYNDGVYEYTREVSDVELFNYSAIIAVVLRDVADYFDNAHPIKVNKNTFDACYNAAKLNKVGSNNVQKLYISNVALIDISIGFNLTIRETPDMFYLYNMVEYVPMFSMGWIFYQNIDSQIYEKFIYIVKYYTSGKYILVYSSGELTEEKKRQNADRAYAMKSVNTIKNLFKHIIEMYGREYANRIEENCIIRYFDRYRDITKDITNPHILITDENRKLLYNPPEMLNKLIELCFRFTT